MGILTDSQDKVFDYIICGGGTAGCVVAGRLAEDPNVSVLLIEAGVTNEKVPASAMPAAWTQVVGTDADYNIQNEANPQLNGRRIDLHRGKFLGGSSGVNGTLCIRGCRQDYDNWKLDGWSGEELFRYMSKAESFHSSPWFPEAKGMHGDSGPIETSPHDPAPISSMILESYQSKGFPYIPDLFTTGESAHGCGHVVRTVHEGVRSTAADYVTGKNSKDNITIRTNHIVDRILLEGQAKRAVGVFLQDSSGAKTLIRARKEVVVSGGAFGSPALLLRSGIGPKAELDRLRIETEIDLPGVGKNLMDHPLTLNFYEVSESGLTTDDLVWRDGAVEKSLAQYQKDHTGFFSQFPFGTYAFARLDDRLSDSDAWHRTQQNEACDPMGLTMQQPHVEIWNTECFGPKAYEGGVPSNGKHAFAMIITLFGGQSRGEVTLKSDDAKDNPIVDHKHLSDPRDLLVLAEGSRLANEIVMEGSGTRNVIAGSWPAHLTHHTHKYRTEWEAHVRANANTCYHPAGTCKMGKDHDEMAVLDEQLRVRGVKNLRVVDASAMPLLMGGHPQMPVYGIAEKAADLIKQSVAA